MVTTVDALFAVAILAGLALCALGVYCYRRWDEPGVAAFTAFVGVLGLASGVGGILGLVHGLQSSSDTIPLWGFVPLLVLMIVSVPWLLFALQYTGRYTRVRRRTVAALSVPPVAGVPVLWTAAMSDDVSAVLLVGQAVFAFYVLFLFIIGVYLVVRTTYEYGHLSLAQGVTLAAAGFLPFFIVNLLGGLVRDLETAAVGLYTATFVGAVAAVALAVFRYDLFESTPAAGTIGERAIARETDDLLFVLDGDGRLIKVNDTARERLDSVGTELLGSSIETVLGADIDTLRDRETLELETGVGLRQFDLQVSAFTDQHDRPLGFVVSLRDVTDRELREQRLEVLNRVLRHNLRNRVEVIKSNAEELSRTTADGHAESIIDAANGLTELGAKARSVDQFVSRSTHATERDLVAEIQSIVDDTGDVQLTAPDSAPLVTDWGALTAALESAIENAAEYADETAAVTIESRPEEYVITIEDDGPGIPDSELAALDAGTETALQHGTGLGLWRLKWGVTTVNGDLSFDTTGGTTVRVVVPDQR